MTQEEKDLLLKDLCARLPYGVKIHIGKTQRIEEFGDINLRIGAINNTYADVRPYLFPLSSMTEEQKIECFKGTPLEIDKYGYIEVKDDSRGNSLYTDLEIYLEVIDWLNKNHFDYRGLIEKSLALDATGLGIYKQE